MIITLAGDVGSGKSTVIKILEKELENYERIDVGYVRRELAKEKGLSIEEFNEWSVDHPEEGDKLVDDKIVKEVQKKRNVLISTRLGPLLYPHSLKIYLSVDPLVAAMRIFEEKKRVNDRNESVVKTIQEQQDKNEERMRNDDLRYKKLYNFSSYDKSQYDLVIDTTEMTPEAVAEKILLHISK